MEFMKKVFLISIDAEGDNFWEWLPGDKITTENALYVARFQALCDKYGFKPTYLTNYEMACDNRFVEFAKPVVKDGRCEIGMHLHAWNSPPLYELPCRADIQPGECSYLIEYPTEVMEKKVEYMTELLENTFEIKPRVHRAGRWATDNRYFEILDKYGYLADCSVAPGMNMQSARGIKEGSNGTDYTSFPEIPYTVKETNLLEIPMTVRENHQVKKTSLKNPRSLLRNYCKALVGRGRIWLRPDGNNLQDMIYLADRVKKEKTDYMMFMLHTSEMMPGGSPAFRSEASIEKLYDDLEVFFKYVSSFCVGKTIGEYALGYRQNSCITYPEHDRNN